MVFEILGHFLFKDGTTVYGHDLHTIRCYLTQETSIRFRGRDLNGFRDIRTLLV
jgi:hypothetical protein